MKVPLTPLRSTMSWVFKKGLVYLMDYRCHTILYTSDSFLIGYGTTIARGSLSSASEICIEDARRIPERQEKGRLLEL